MRKLLIVLILLCFCSLSHAWMSPIVCGGSACTPAYSPTELYTTATAVSDPNANEADATTGWTNNNMATMESTSDGTPYAGTYHMHIVANNAYDFCNVPLPGDNGKHYRLTLYAKHGGEGGSFRLQMGYQGNMRCFHTVAAAITSADTTYVPYIFWYHKTVDCDYMQIGDVSSGDGSLYIDNMSVVEQTTQCLGDELFTDLDAASLSNETDGIGNWAVSASSSIASVADPADGTYALKFTAGANNGCAYIDLNGYMTVDKKYFISWKLKQDAGDAGVARLASNPNIGNAYNYAYVISTTSYVYNGAYVIYDGSNARYLGVMETGANDNAVLYIDSISIKEVTDD